MLLSLTDGIFNEMNFNLIVVFMHWGAQMPHLGSPMHDGTKKVAE